MRRSLPLVALASGFVALFASSSTAVVNAGESGLIAGTSGTYTITITAGDVAIHCWRLTAPPGVTITGAQGPAGWQVGASGGIAGGQAPQGSGIPAGQSRTFTFTTTPAYPIDPGNDRLDVSATCLAGSDRAVPVTGPRVPVAPPPPADKPCKCKTLNVKLDGTLINKAPHIAIDDHEFGVGLKWTMKCTKGAGKCKGFVNFRPPEILAGQLPKPKQNLLLNLEKVAFVCQANCGQAKSQQFQIKMLSRDQLNVLFGRTLAYTVKTKCGNVKKTIKVMVSIDQNGKLRPGRG